MAETITALSEQLFDALQKESFALLSTIDHETGAPAMNAISWLYAKDEKTIRFAVDQRSRIGTNLKKQPLVNLTFIGAGSVHAVYGTARLVAEALDGVPFKLACYDIDISAVRDAMFYGASISVAPEYEKTYDKRAAEKLDTQVFDAMKKA
ncbi:pyridoxamine 5'-phosphate oxidase family protein [Paenibacillus naphthalenovorans]|uniref:Pyridoxamine 5'-phosphate oxidase n=1 Tax=Paenibacillus naphthalenovorans TaxID=162209 RepID=A0A0U2UHH9_9BACL|nr:pyridoxamine 5'-phosphate oxidase family protein [Paenibacillus naphthalenovorans]ALS21345.1 pyridoxamine 5'-phosphate oxidase [Paenibacillus naphthalenovorans]